MLPAVAFIFCFPFTLLASFSDRPAAVIYFAKFYRVSIPAYDQGIHSLFKNGNTLVDLICFSCFSFLTEAGQEQRGGPKNVNSFHNSTVICLWLASIWSLQKHIWPNHLFYAGIFQTYNGKAFLKGG